VSTDYLYNITKNETEKSVTVFAGLDQYVASGDMPNYDKIVEAVLRKAPLSEVEGLFDLAKPLADKFARITDRVTVDNGNVFFDGDIQEGPVADTLVRFYNEGNQDFLPLVNFLERVGQNPNEHSREHLGRWLANESFSITRNGFIVAYKGVYENEDGSYRPSRNGPGVSVNDVPVPPGEYATQRDGDVVSMARSEVEFDPAVACSAGLHVGTYDYALRFTRFVIEVLVDPRDVVSVPTDCNDQKMRTCKYLVMDHVTEERKVLFDVTLEPEEVEYEDQNPEDDSDWDDDYGWGCGHTDCDECSEDDLLDQEDDDDSDDNWSDRLQGFAVSTDPAFEVVGFLFYSDDEGLTEAGDTPKTDNKEGTNVSDSKQDYANYKKADFKTLTRTTLRTIAKAWGVKAGGSKEVLVDLLARKAGDIRWNRKRGQGFQG
jgi:hypothetical protein